MSHDPLHPMLRPIDPADSISPDRVARITATVMERLPARRRGADPGTLVRWLAPLGLAAMGGGLAPRAATALSAGVVLGVIAAAAYPASPPWTALDLVAAAGPLLPIGL